MITLVLRVAIAASLAGPGAPGAPPAPEAVEPSPRPVEELRAEAGRLVPLAASPLARQFLEATADLPVVEGTRVVWWDRTARRALSPERARAMSPEELQDFREMPLDERFYYYTAYGTPLAYVRPLDLAAAAGFESADGRRILDFGFGGIGHLRLLASLGGRVVGVEVLELLRELYREPGDTGAVARSAAALHGPAGPPGSLTLLYGSFPGDESIRRAVGGGYDLVLSKNVLKRGYVHPEREADPRLLVHLGVDDGTFVRAVYEALAPGGLFVIYNLYPKQSPPGEAYIPHATGECPFARPLVEAAGFEVVAFDADDTPAARAMGEALGWSGSMDLQDDLFGMYTILRRPAK
jgi:hypothetical protein